MESIFPMSANSAFFHSGTAPLIGKIYVTGNGTTIALSPITILSELFYSSQTPSGLTFLSLCRISSLGLKLSSLFRTSFSFPISLTLPLPQFPKLALLSSLGHGVFDWLVFLLRHVHPSFFSLFCSLL